MYNFGRGGFLCRSNLEAGVCLEEWKMQEGSVGL